MHVFTAIAKWLWSSAVSVNIEGVSLSSKIKILPRRITIRKHHHQWVPFTSELLKANLFQQSISSNVFPFGVGGYCINTFKLAALSFHRFIRFSSGTVDRSNCVQLFIPSLRAHGQIFVRKLRWRWPRSRNFGSKFRNNPSIDVAWKQTFGLIRVYRSNDIEIPRNNLCDSQFFSNICCIQNHE